VDVTKFLKTIEGAGFYKRQIEHRHMIPVRRAKFKELGRPLPEKLAAALKKTGIKKLYTHQVYAIDSLRKGNDVVV
jgi:DEAD/DEAH box helicase domain-containing protein